MRTDVTKPLKLEVIEQLPWLFADLHFRIVDDGYDPDAFGNSWVTVVCSTFLARFVRDRGQIWIEVASKTAPKNWWAFENVLAPCRKEWGDVYDSVIQPADILRRELDTLTEGLGTKFLKTRSELSQADRERKRVFMAAARSPRDDR